MWSQAGDGLRPGWGGWDGEGEAGGGQFAAARYHSITIR